MQSKMKFTKEQQDYIKHCAEHFEVLTSGRGHCKTKELIEELEKERNYMACLNNELQERIDKAIEFINDLDVECNDDYDFYIMSSEAYCNPKIELLEILGGDNNE